MIYIVFDELGKRPTEEYMRELEAKVATVDGVDKVDMACVNDSMDAAQLLASLDMNNPDNWGKLKIVMLPESGEIKGYLPRRLLEDFKASAEAGKSSYEVFRKIIGDDTNNGGNA
ncbi:MAG: hypothetical protein ACK5MU_04540 [Candidatus Saccharimonadales bacterium]